uniref:Cyclic AMP-responsive element-binding protein 3-like protein 4 n=2 Tax=Iconisemion striatum TaxID=60296 RepID=A0A1A7XZI9_9TELE
MDAESGDPIPGGEASGSWLFHAPFYCSKDSYTGPEEPLQDRVVDPEPSTLSDSESDDVLHGVNPNQLFSSSSPVDLSSESDVSKEDILKSPIPVVMAVATETSQQAPATVFQVVYDISSMGGTTFGPDQANIISIELADEWKSRLLFSDSCIVNEVPATSSSCQDSSRSPTPLLDRDQEQLYSELQLTEEEQKLLTEEGVHLPSNLPLTKVEERILKKVRRKIRNKQSAQDSRRRRKEYIDGLESRVAACSVQNQQLQHTVEHLEKHNRSLLVQLQQLQALIRQTVSKGVQTSTCLLIVLVSLSLIILPSFSPFSRRSADDDYRPIGVISRNILTDASFSNPTADVGASPISRSEALSPLSELSQSEPPGLPQDPVGAAGGMASNRSQSGNLPAVAGQMNDLMKPAHADEM